MLFVHSVCPERYPTIRFYDPQGNFYRKSRAEDGLALYMALASLLDYETGVIISSSVWRRDEALRTLRKAAA